MNYSEIKLRIYRFSILAIIAFSACGSIAYANGIEKPSVELEAGLTPQNGMMQTKTDTSGYEKPDNKSLVVEEIKKGQSVMLSGKTENGWCQVVYQGRTMYVQENSLEETVNEELSNELQELEKLRLAEAEWDIKARKEVLRSRIWGTVIVVLIVGIFAAGMVSVIRADKGEKRKKEGNEQRQEKANDGELVK